MTEPQDNHSSKREGLGFFKLIQSVLAAFIGVQSEERRQEDFEKITPKQVFLAGIILTAIFMATVILITRTLLAAYT